MPEEASTMISQKRKHDLPIDRGWAWVVLTAAFFQFFLFVGTLKSFGLFFVEFLQAYGTTASMVSLVLSLQTGMFSFIAFFVMTFGHKYFSSRQLVMAGGFITALGYFLNGFAPTVGFLIFSHGFVHASGCAATYGPTLIVLSSYFHKRKGLANSMANVGGSIGSLVIPLFIRYLLDTFGLQGSLMIMSGLLLNIITTGSLMRPISKTKDDCVEPLHNEQEIIVEIKVNDEGKEAVNGHLNSCQNNGQEDKVSSNFLQVEHQISVHSNKSNGEQHIGSTRSIDKVIQNLSGSTFNMYGSMGNIASSVSAVNKAYSETSDHVSHSSIDIEKTNCLSSFCADLHVVKLLKNHRFQLIMLIGFCCIFGSALTLTFIPPFAKDHNVSDNKIALLITISAVCDFIGRFSVAWVADSGVVKRNHLVGICVGINGLAAMLNFLYTDFLTFAVYAAIFGLVGGVYFSLYPLLIVEAVGPENLSNGLAIIFPVHGVSLMLNSFLIGYLRDITGSYQWSFVLMGSGLLLGTVFLFCEPLARKLEHRRTMLLKNDI